MEQPTQADEPVIPEPIEIRKLDKIETTGGHYFSNPSGN